LATKNLATYPGQLGNVTIASFALDGSKSFFMEANMDLFWVIFILSTVLGTVGYAFFIYELFVATKNETNK